MKFISTASFGNSNRKQDLIYQNSFFKKTWFHTFVTYVIQSSFQLLALKFQKQNQRLEFSSEILQNVCKDNFISSWDMWQEVHWLLLQQAVTEEFMSPFLFNYPSKLTVKKNILSHISQWYGILFSWWSSDENSNLVLNFMNLKR